MIKDNCLATSQIQGESYMPEKTAENMDFTDESYWLQISEALAKRVQNSDFSFVDGYKLAPKLKAAMICVLTISASETGFPKLEKLYTKCLAQGFESWALQRLAFHGLLYNPIPRGGVWYLTKKAGDQIIMDGSVVEEIKNEPNVEPDPNLVEQPFHNVKLRDGLVKKFYQFLLKKRIKNYYLSLDEMRRVATKWHIKVIDIWRVLAALEHHYYIKKQDVRYKEGLMIIIDGINETVPTENTSFGSFPTTPSSVVSVDVNPNEVIRAIDLELDEADAAINKLVAEREKLNYKIDILEKKINRLKIYRSESVDFFQKSF
jgi:hypothetical protein